MFLYRASIDKEEEEYIDTVNTWMNLVIDKRLVVLFFCVILLFCLKLFKNVADRSPAPSERS